ncbi:helix-turn-helix transcriptional regulator [Parapedobacter sp. 2B3]|uniref:helix-turn-helix transcriptional regulator n=1 Tax=Parapedobacter sp. 2B3 TaxID=3342381 RepID=UPI0035B696ED
MSVRKRLIAGLPDGIRPLPVSSVCGGSILNLKNKHMRMHYKCTPLVSDASGNVVLSFDYMEDITTLMTTANGYWMRFNLNGQPAHWHSDRRKTVRKDILSPREKLLIGLCQKGHAIGEIAEMVSVSRQTAKNQLNTVRNRLFARDNTSLVQLSLLAGLLDTTS